ncbi:hypothetical protein GCM10009635_45840 [Actinocatenispora thailandica]
MSVSTSFSFFTSDTRVDSSGLPLAAVATGTFAIAAVLPGFDGSVGIFEHAAPNGFDAGSAGFVLVAAADGVLDEPLPPESLLPHAASGNANAAVRPTAATRCFLPMIEPRLGRNCRGTSAWNGRDSWHRAVRMGRRPPCR